MYGDHMYTGTPPDCQPCRQEPDLSLHPPPQLLAWREVDRPQSLRGGRHRDKEKMSWAQEVEF